jgi:hypothetical protein
MLRARHADRRTGRHRDGKREEKDGPVMTDISPKVEPARGRPRTRSPPSWSETLTSPEPDCATYTAFGASPSAMTVHTAGNCRRSNLGATARKSASLRPANNGPRRASTDGATLSREPAWFKSHAAQQRPPATDAYRRTPAGLYVARRIAPVYPGSIHRGHPGTWIARAFGPPAPRSPKPARGLISRAPARIAAASPRPSSQAARCRVCA